ncbi:MAG: hypothetical protein M1812_007500 [Candelaria pacifica]|nr:MAG: hypothetical protein M1812_007500 [Candelaria pacifica]
MALQHSASHTPQTIWTLVPESQFAEKVWEVLNKSGQVPEEAHVYNQIRGQTFPENYQLPYNIEYQLAQDLAFIAAHEESVHTVSAATIEEAAVQDGLIFNIATNSGVGFSVRETLPEIGKLLEQCARKESRAPECMESVFISIVRLCEPKIISRLKCKDWIAPAYYHKRRQEPMHKDLKDAVDRHQRRSGEHSDEMKETVSSLQEFINFMTKANSEIPTLNFETRLEALWLAGKVCDTKSSLETTFQRAGAKLDIASLKTIKAFDKLANYRHIGERLSRMAASSKFRHLFKSVQFKFLDCYESHWVKRRERFVHAEVQLATFHRLQKTRPSPRTIGTSKAACYLCNLFLSLHPQYRISATHGVIFDAWTIPDVISYSEEDRKELRNVVQSMQNTLGARAGKRSCKSLQFPIQSGIYQVPSLPSLAGTVIDPIAPIIGKSHSIVQTNSSAQGAIEVSLVGSIDEAATIPLVDHDVGSPPEIITQTPKQKSVIADEQHGEELRLQEKQSLCREPKLDENPEYEKGAEPSEDLALCTEANLNVDAVNSGVSGPEETTTGKQGPMVAVSIYGKDSNNDLEPIRNEPPAVGERHQSIEESDGGPVNDRVSKPSDRPALDEERVEQLQMPCIVDPFPERLNPSNEPVIKIHKISPHDDADDNANDICESIAPISSDYSNKFTLAVIQADIVQELSGEVEQVAPQSSKEKHSRKKRRRRRHNVKNRHGNSRKDHETLRSKRSGSSRNRSSQRSRKRRGPGRGSNKPTQRSHRFKRRRSRHGILQGLLKVFHTTKRLFCG